MDKGGMYLYH